MITPRILNFIGYRCIELAEQIDNVSTYPKDAARKYAADDPFEMKVVTFPLNPESQVVDVGGYTGDWAQRIYGRYGCFIDIYEPHPVLADAAQKNFAPNAKVVVFPIGLGNKGGTMTLYGDNVHASVFKNNLRGSHPVVINKASEVFRTRYRKRRIHLMKINVEGAEYDILGDLTANFDMTQIDDMVIQFHRNVPDYDIKRNLVRDALARTHAMKWSYDYIFEHWTLRR